MHGLNWYCKYNTRKERKTYCQYLLVLFTSPVRPTHVSFYRGNFLYDSEVLLKLIHVFLQTGQTVMSA